MADPTPFDAVIIGAGISGSIIAAQLGLAGKKVLILEAGPGVPTDRSGYMNNFYMDPNKFPESPYPPLTPTAQSLVPGQQATPRATIQGLQNWKNPDESYLIQPTPQPPSATPPAQNLPFGSTNERVAGGTTWHWLGTSLRMIPSDLTMGSTASAFPPEADWPVSYDELSTFYGQAEGEIGVSASVAQQAPLEAAIGLTYPSGYQYPMNPIPPSLVDQAVSAGVQGMTSEDGQAIFVTPTPAGRNSQPYKGRRVCAGNTNCIPICPIQAKYDATYTLGTALDTGNVQVIYQAVVSKILTGPDGSISGVQYLPWTSELNPGTPTPVTVTGTVYVLAAHAIENAKLLLMSANESFPNGLANSSDQVGRNLMDHPLYLSWALAPSPIYPYRGPLSTSGIESLRNGPFRSQRAAFRMEIGNEGWNFPIGDPYTTVNDFINGTNISGLNPITPPGTTSTQASQVLGGPQLVQALNDVLPRQFRIACLVEQTPQASNRVTLDPVRTDGLGLPRPNISYGLDEYTLQGFAAARATCSAIYQRMNATEFTNFLSSQPGFFEFQGVPYVAFGSGHMVGTHRMGASASTSVVNASQQSWDHGNLWIVGSGSFPTVATSNPTLTVAALAFKTAASLLQSLGS